MNQKVVFDRGEALEVGGHDIRRYFDDGSVFYFKICPFQSTRNTPGYISRYLRNPWPPDRSIAERRCR